MKKKSIVCTMLLFVFIFSSLQTTVKAEDMTDRLSSVGTSTDAFADTDALQEFWSFHYMDQMFLFVFGGESPYAGNLSYSYDDMLSFISNQHVYVTGTHLFTGWLNEDNGLTFLLDKEFYQIPFSDISQNSTKAYQGTYISYLGGTMHDIVGDVFYVPCEVSYTIKYQNSDGEDIEPPEIKTAFNTFVVSEAAKPIVGYQLQNEATATQVKAIYHPLDHIYHIEEIEEGLAGDEFIFVYEKVEEPVDFSIHFLNQHGDPLLKDGVPFYIEDSGFVSNSIDLFSYQKIFEGYTFTSAFPSNTVTLEESDNIFYLYYTGKKKNVTLRCVDEKNNILQENFLSNLFDCKVGDILSFETTYIPQINGYACIDINPTTLSISPKDTDNVITLVYKKELPPSNSNITYTFYYVDELLRPIKNYKVSDQFFGKIGESVKISGHTIVSPSGYTYKSFTSLSGTFALQKESTKNIFYVVFQEKSLTGNVEDDSSNTTIKSSPNNTIRIDKKQLQLIKKVFTNSASKNVSKQILSLSKNGSAAYPTQVVKNVSTVYLTQAVKNVCKFLNYPMFKVSFKFFKS